MAKKPDAKAEKSGDSEFMSELRKRVDRAWTVEKDNIANAYDDLRFASGDQWPAELRKQRESEGRPCLTINHVLQFCRQVTGDMRQSRPAIKVYGVDDKADKETAEAFNEVIRHIENRSDAKEVYFRATDSQVLAGIGHLRIVTEEVRQNSKEQEIRVLPVEDGVSVLWDPDAIMPGKVDAKWCFVPADYEFDTLKKKYPDAQISSFETYDQSVIGLSDNGPYWTSGDKVRIGEYYCVETDGKTKERIVSRYIVSGSEVLEGPQLVPGGKIPVVPVVGEEIRIGANVVRFGKVRHLRPVQMAYNYWNSAQTEVVALQPKAPFIGTDRNFEEHPEWQEANNRNLPFLTFTPDPLNGGAAPQRATPPVASSGFEQAIARARSDMQSVTGIYDAALGARSNETSGTAIRARQQEGDTGTFVYMANFTMSLQQLGRVMVAMIPHIYDTNRILRITGEDGAVNEVEINKPVGVGIIDEDGKTELTALKNDLSVGEFDVVVETGPSYTTKRAEARDGMMQFLQAAPNVAPLILDLVAKGQDWPMSDKIAERLRMALPDPIKAREDKEAGGDPNYKPLMAGPDPQQQQAAAMQQQMQQQAMQMEMAGKQAEVQGKQAQARKAAADAAKAELELQRAQVEVAAMMQPPPVQQHVTTDPHMEQVIQMVQQLAGTVQGIVQALQPPMPSEMPMGQQPYA